MAAIKEHSTVDLFFQTKWTSGIADHTDAYAARQVNLWRDLLPQDILNQLMGRQTGDGFTVHFNPGVLLEPHRVQDVRDLSRIQFQPERVGRTFFEPRPGRFYPKGVLKDIAGVFSENIEPFRCVRVNNGNLSVDLGHPLADISVDLQITIGSVSAKTQERGGTMRDWPSIVTSGPGMQARWRQTPTDFFSDEPFSRADESPDAVFYTRPRLIQHLDDAAIDMVRQLHGRFIRNDMRVLDLMSSWQSHLPLDVSLKQVTGLGMNAMELERNTALNESVVHDLNENPVLPFSDASFDAVVCTASIEYLIHPLDVFKQVARVLKPGGVFAVTFSNRWFPPKAVSIWKDLHEFERMGLVLE